VSNVPESVREAVRRVTDGLTAAGVDDAGTDARRLVAAALNATAARLIADPTRTLSGGEQTQLAAFTRRRQNREPVSRILGQREFYGRTFLLSPAVLDPRPDTETVIDVALEQVRQSQSVRVLDIGTGSGALLLTLLAEWPQATGVGTDISADALSIARTNASALGLSDRATFQLADMQHGIPTGFDVIVSNPPYIPSGDLAGLSPEVRQFDPKLALDGGRDGLVYYRALAAALSEQHGSGPKPRLIVLEVGAGQSAAVTQILQPLCGEAGQILSRRDLGGHVRCVALKTQT
jgi:release factor glutamine methyltransferase